MELKGVKKILKISIEVNDLTMYLKALKGCIDMLSVPNTKLKEDIMVLIRFATELKKILGNVVDY